MMFIMLNLVDIRVRLAVGGGVVVGVGRLGGGACMSKVWRNVLLRL